MNLLPISHRRQQQQADCLAACAAMVLDYLQVPISYVRLLRLLNIRAHGAAFANLRNLANLGVAVVVAEGDLEHLQKLLASGLPPLVAVATRELGYWTEDTDHVVVVTGIAGNLVYIHDPDLGAGPVAVTRVQFESAWLEEDYRFAVLTLTTIGGRAVSDSFQIS